MRSHDHLLVSARNRHAAASWLGEPARNRRYRRSAGSPPGTFAASGSAKCQWTSQTPTGSRHALAFLVSDADFDTILDRVLQAASSTPPTPDITARETHDNEAAEASTSSTPTATTTNSTPPLEKSRQ